MGNFTQRQPVLFELDGRLLQGWYVSTFGPYNSTVTLEAPEEWLIRGDGVPMPGVYTRRNEHIRPWISPERMAETRGSLDAAGTACRDAIESLPEYDGDDIRNRDHARRSGLYVLADGSVIEVTADGACEIRPPRAVMA
jgi:hypothetical protein